MHALFQDVRATLRSLAREPGFTFTAVVTTGLGIGATTLIFSVVYGVLFKPLPYQDPEKLVSVWNHLVEERQFLPAVHAGDFRDYQAMSETFQEFAAATVPSVVRLQGVLTGEGPPLSVDLLPVTHNFFSLLGVDPILGRHFTIEEEAFNGPRVAILSHEFWRSRYGSDESILGRSIQIDGQRFSVVGVLPREFRLLLPDEVLQVQHSEIWVPLQRDYSRLPPRNWTEHTVIGRLKPDVTLAQAQAEMDRIAEELRAVHPAHANSGMQIHLVPLQQDIVKNARPVLLLLLGAVGFVLLLACANVAHLLLCRNSARRKELAIRTALGASRGAIVQRVFVESLTIGILGSGFGLLMTSLGLRGITLIQPPNLPRVTELGVSGAVWAFAAIAALVAAAACGLVPVYQASRTQATNLLKDGSRAGRSAGAARARNAFVISEVAFSLALLVGAGLMFRSFQALSDVRPGFKPEGALTFGVSLPRTDYPAGPSVLTFYDELRARLGGLPGVEAVGGVSQLPLTGQPGLWNYAYDEETAEHFNLSADGLIATEGFFRAMGIDVVAGRGFTSEDHLESALAVIVDEMLANRAWPEGNPIGQQLQMRFGQNLLALTVVGVVRHTRIYDLTQDVREHLYLSHRQFPAPTMNIVVRAPADPMSLASAVQDEVWALDANLPLDKLRPLEAYVRDDMADTRFTLMLMAVFGALALVLAVVGVYGVNSYAMGQRSQEFAIRLALGENPGGLVRFVMLGGARIVLVGVGVGLLASFALARSMGGLLFGVSAVDVWTYATLAGVLTGVALVASYVPARRTAKADPVASLKAD